MACPMPGIPESMAAVVPIPVRYIKSRLFKVFRVNELVY
jgi:hypothetical protein